MPLTIDWPFYCYLLGFPVVLGVAIASAIYYYFNNESNCHRYDYSRNERGFTGNPFNEHCAICLDAIDIFRRIRVLHCRHTFHEHCIIKWLKQKRLCPVCRVTVIRGRKKNAK